MMAKQLIQPDLSVKANAGWCLWFTQEVYRVPHYYPSAWIAWTKTTNRYTSREMPGVSVPVWFSHWGTYGIPAKYDNWGHVVTWVPARRQFLSVIGIGYGQLWFNTIEEIERYFNAKFVGWTEDISGLMVANIKEEVYVDRISKELENTMSFLATGDYPGPGYDYRWTGQPMTESVLSQFVNFWLAESRNVGITAKVKAQDDMIKSLLESASKTPVAESIKLTQITEKAQEIIAITK